MRPQLFQLRTIWCPTILGWVVLLMLLGAPGVLWWFQGEAFLAITQRQAADVLVVEGWIGTEGVRAAKCEFEQGGYRYIVATSGLTGNSWDLRRWSFAAEAEEVLLGLGVPRNQVILATPRETDEHRTYEAALATRQALLVRGIRFKAINVFTEGVHARRSRLVFAKAFEGGAKTGVIAWAPAATPAKHWWRSSSRADDFLKESVGCALEALFDSGRSLTSTAALPEHEAGVQP